MYSSHPSFILGFHGCDKALAHQVIKGRKSLKQSTNDYDWLGHGIYFWENDPERALLFARETACRENNAVQSPAVIGAVIDLGYCLNLVESENLTLLKNGYELLVAASASQNDPLPANSDDLLLRHLDCAVIETVHHSREEEKEKSFDSVRAVFWEGENLYPNAGFKEKNHIQVCIRNPNCIKGFFRVRDLNEEYPIP